MIESKVFFSACIRFFLRLSLTLLLFGCTGKDESSKTQKSDSLSEIISITKTPGGADSLGPIGDSTDIYGTGNFDYRDTLETYHRGYSIPRDSIYKVYNIKAFQKLDLQIKKHPLKPGPYLDRGNHFQNIKLYREAIEDYNMYIKMNPYNQSAYMNRGNAYERLKKYDSAIADYNTVLKLKPDDTIANFNKGNIYDILGRFEEAVKQYDTVIMKDPRLAKAYYNRGTTYTSLRNYTLAIRDWEEAVRLNPPYEPDLRPRINRLKQLIK
jgi:tetratricopeptide (TPR) repeat protein